MLECPNLTDEGIASAIRERPTLKSLSVRWSSYQSPDNSRLHFIHSLMNLEGLTSLDLSFSHISDDLLSTIAMRGLPLRRLVLRHCTGYSYAGIFGLLSKCQHIQHLDLETVHYVIDRLNDQCVSNLSLILGNLMSINLTGQDLTNLALFALARNCPSLSEIKMEYSHIGEASIDDSNPFMDFVVNPQLKFLYLHGGNWLDTNIIMLASIFPNLQPLDLSSCDNISGHGIYQVLRRCCKIRHLNLAHCSRVKLCGINLLKVSKLEVLNLSHTSVDDETLCDLNELLWNFATVTGKL
ncbi:F-box/LRR-repeat protein [Trifolium repens]|nr:F-box/LRR-repeat protein [Trifolium repens]